MTSPSSMTSMDVGVRPTRSINASSDNYEPPHKISAGAPPTASPSAAAAGGSSGGGSSTSSGLQLLQLQLQLPPTVVMRTMGSSASAASAAASQDYNDEISSSFRQSLPINLKVIPVRPHLNHSDSTSSSPAGSDATNDGGVNGANVGGNEPPESRIVGQLREAFDVADGSNALVLQESTKNLAQFYGSLIGADKASFMRTLATKYGTDHHLVEHLAGLIAPALARASKSDVQLHRAEDRLRQALLPRYHQLFVQFSRLDHGIAFLVNFRADLITLLRSPGIDQDSSSLQSMNTTLYTLLSLWMSPGSLKLERITWTSPCDLLQKISAYEAVQPIRNWSDLRRRVGPYRRCFAFTHSCLPREPVVVVHTALAPQISRSIQAFTGDKPMVGGAFSDSEIEDMGREDDKFVLAAIFYSITSTQKGLQGVELGNNLIKRIISELVREFPRLSQFSSLSPIPGFRDWLLEEIGKFIRLQQMGEHQEQRLLTDTEIADISGVFGSFESTVFELLREVLRTDAWVDQPHLTQILSGPLMRLCARYLYVEKKRGYAVNPVANFHLRNGAILWRLNWMSDTSTRGLAGSCSIMANYRYYPDQAEENMRNYVQRQVIPASRQIYDLVDASACARTER